MAKKQKRKTASKHIIGFVLTILLVAALTCGIIVLIKQLEADKNEKDNVQDKNTASDVVKTEDDLKDENKVAQPSNDAKDRMEADEEAKEKTVVDQDESGKKIAKPEITFIAEENGKIVIGGDVSNINETGGTCTYIFTKGDNTITAGTGILPNPSYISCETARIDKSKFTSGTWSVKIQYKSNTSEGESETQSVEI